MGSVVERFIQAVRERTQLVCVYGGFHRECCVHVVGWKNGHARALVFQFAGDSAKGLPPGGDWRCLSLDDVSGILLRGGPWHTGDGDLASQSCVDDVAAAVCD